MKKHFLGVIFTDHALQRLRERKIAQSDAWYTWKHPDQQLRGTTPGSYRYRKTYGRQQIEVIAKQNEKREWIILSCWSKIKGNQQPIFRKRGSFFRNLSQKLGWLWKLVTT